jgi:hypothetical protein
VSPSILRLGRFEAVGVGFDAALRDALVPAVDGVPGLRALFGGRLGPGHGGARVVATVWSSGDDLEAAERAGSAVVHVGTDLVPGSPAGVPETFPVVLEVEAARDAPITIVRVVRGRTRPGELEGYLDDARAGVLGDHATGGGPLALYLTADAPDRFLTLSLWGAWSHVEAATGADHRHVDRTRHAERLASWTTEHYEVVPGLAVIRPGG